MNIESSAIAASDPKNSCTRFLPAIARILLGLPLVIFGANAIHDFMHMTPPPLKPAAGALLGGLTGSGYMMQLIGGTQLVSGLCFLTNRFVPFGLAILAPFIVHSVLFHAFLEPTGLPMAGVFAALEIYLAWAYRRAFAPMLAARVTPN